MSGCHHGHNHSRPSEHSYPELNLGPGAKWIKNLTKDRLSQFTGGHFSDVNLSSVLFTHRLDGSENVKLQVWSAPGLTKPSFEEAMKQTFRPAKKGDAFGPSWTNHWWKVTLHIPSYWEQYERVQFEFDPGCEAMVFSTDGTPLQGITGGHGGDRRVDHIIPPKARKAGVYEIVIESSCNGMFGVPTGGDTIAPPDMNRYFTLASADLVVPNEEAWRLLWDFTTLREIADTLLGNTALQNKAVVTANAIMNAFDTGDPASISRARKVAEDVLGKDWQAKGADIYKGDTNSVDIWGIGHCHIDSAWLWPFRVTQQKVARSWSTQVDLMNRYPEHRFAASSAQQYKWLEQLYPKAFENVKAKIKSGQFHIVGGSWVENDGNMPSGEGLIRQFLFGQRYFESRFGVRCETAWLPDSFGLTGAYPQIIRSAGMKYFFTQKLSWNNVNVFPHSTFNWVGIDGTQVLCHMTPVDTYTAQATVGDIRRGIVNHKNLESNNTALLVFGNGDGGGGPLNKMLENLRRIRAAANESRELPVVNMGHSIEDFFRDVDKKTAHGKKLPAWHGELYLEFHRGTYTSHGSIKKGNRESEILLRDVELVATLASVLQLKKYDYPKERIEELWEKVLLCQFHDVLPGSSIGMVYEDAEQYYAEVRKGARELIDDAIGSLLQTHSVPISSDALSSASGPGTLVAFNTTILPRLDVIPVPLLGPAASQLKNVVVQTADDGKSGFALVAAQNGQSVVTPCGFPTDCNAASVSTRANGDFVLRNAFVELTISDGRITSLVDKQIGRELIFEGESGGMVIFEDRPNYWDAWDVEIHHLEKRTPLKFSDVKVVARGPLRAAVEATVKIGKSTAIVTISLDAIPASVSPSSRPYFRFDAHVDWHERHQFLKFELPLNIHSDTATYESQFGWVQRPTHKNTTWDAAKFEVCGHKYADLSEYGYGVAILSESKYGFSCIGNILRISLLRGATAPDAEQDQGEHDFSWAVLPHVGHFLQSDVVQAAYLFNSPLLVRYTQTETLTKSTSILQKPPFSIRGAPNVILETVKRGEDDLFGTASSTTSTTKKPKTIILRIYEALGGHAQAFLRVFGAFPVVKAYETNILEDELKELSVFRANEDDGNGGDDAKDVEIKLDFRGFEVKTVKLVLGEVGVPK
ncbi:glycoside hydrolase family 38 protein [Fomitiporia mediterranea MF3/22]|uniref:glycoside hydrolase family 38 protein n=1 Tax=Fomitiporia mediterranea (strain MF3/22) TaxID=694068 RepID=UPI0004409192|nr:glycoside hydrolase family 38 protein [Fomitiporia mediterranea MF3/22]EJD05282.1 glycoside hydrolase family 38 protein [Fomitiporia mediterranea MF3/22]